MFRSSSMCRPVRTGMTLNNKEIQNQKENFRRTRSQETKEDGKMFPLPGAEYVFKSTETLIVMGHFQDVRTVAKMK